MKTRDSNQQISGKQPKAFQNNQPIHIVEETSTIPYDIDEDMLNSHNQYNPESLPQFGYPSYIQPTQPYPSFYPQTQRKLPRHQRSYTDALEEALHQQTVLNIEQMIFQNSQIIENLTKENQKLQNHLQNIKQLFEIRRLNHSQSSAHHPPIKSEAPNSIKPQNQKPQPKRQYSQPINVKTTQEIRSELKKKIKTEKVAIFKPSKLPSNQSQLKKQPLTNPYKGCINYTTESWAIEQNYVMRFLHLWLKINVQKVNDETMIIDKKIIMGCYENWRNLQKFEIQSNLKTAQVQQILTIEVKAFFKCPCSSKGFAGLEFTKEEFKQFGDEQKSEESDIQGLELNEEREDKAE